MRNEGLEKRAATNRFLINQLQREIVELKALVTVPVSKPNLAPAGHDGGRRINRERRSLTQPNLGSIDLSRLSPQEYAAKKIQKFFRHFRLRSRWKEIGADKLPILTHRILVRVKQKTSVQSCHLPGSQVFSSAQFRHPRNNRDRADICDATAHNHGSLH